MTAIIVERQRIGQPAAGEDEPLLVREIGDVVDAAERLGMRPAAQEARFEQLSDLARRDRTIADAAGRGFDLDQRLEPKEAARSGADDLNVEAAAARLVRDRAGDRVRADGERRRIGGNEDAHAHCVFRCGAGDDRVDAIAIETADRLAVEQGGGGEGAVAEAIDRFDVKARMVVLVVDLDPVTEVKVRNEVFASHGLTGFGAAKLQHPAVDRRAAEIVIEADHAERFGSRDVERVGDQRNGGVVDVAELLLQIVQDRQRRARLRRACDRSAFAPDQDQRPFGQTRYPPGSPEIMRPGRARFKLNLWKER